MLSLAEHTGLHDRLDGLGGQILGAGPFAEDWLPLGAVAGLGVAATLGLLAVRVGGSPGWLLVAGAATLLAGALGGELAVRLLLARGGPGTAYVLTYHAAELAENIGALLLFAAAASGLTLTRDGTVLRLHYRASAAPAGTGSRS